MSKRIRVPDAVALELEAMALVYRELMGLSERSRQRVLDYLWDRYVREPEERSDG